MQEDKKNLLDTRLNTSTVIDQFLVAADLKPRRYLTKWQEAYFEGPTARKDAESAERSRWTSLFADLLRNTTTPMEATPQGKPCQFSALGRRQPGRYFAFKGTKSFRSS